MGSYFLFFLVRNGAIVVLWLGQQDSSLRTDLIKYLTPTDTTLLLFSTEVQLRYWLNTNSSLKVTSLIIEASVTTQNFLASCHDYKTVRSILIRCQTTELIDLQRFSRSFVKIDSIYADDTRVLIKLVIDLALVSEEMGDEEREDKNNELEAQRHYARALKLCELAKQL